MPDVRLRDFEAQRPRLLRLAYRMIGSLAEAEDVVQEAWLRWARTEDSVDTPAAYLTRIVTRLCLDHIKSARVRRETYVGAWLPEPLLGTVDPEAEQTADDLTLTLMLALERLSPLERAAFLLHDVFGVALGDVATTLDRDAAAVRQLAVRARRHVHAAKPRYRVAEAEADRIARAFFAAARDGDTQALGSMLADDVILHSDGGGRVIAFLNIIRGLDRVKRLFAGLSRKSYYRPVLLRRVEIDGLPGYISCDRGGALQTTALELRDGKIAAIYMVRNPDKLRHIEALAAEDEAALAGGTT
ncbi:sigma-70 family RNA polymerase sigma factor [Sphingomonas sp. BIUV-7]|uniref:Sigma-70 family RNA polymerase sigma factor n=1 Tax=Sphingomonas natans TaxID=3063330 RepID=A0ABT8YDW0_9SPHN|nr:sigma-70 family RNA polymerase sigma factor [Sphingomonas sp. BIUV-7]MDO6416571.1 sigma-70 family RNA polymerase sigma factor [Sphingomonas sp. BIUV-7]